ncbi:PREDICTED: C-C motif chemokine 5-like [Cariama cristata]|uniref:C-C motif chemokine 5-like n=1 Tax=Cariama cristata TaxID=54380 RepID=UPI000520FA6A|nr:PREDICTED: C-C motif chemokine 5-like [Cariama cristata]
MKVLAGTLAALLLVAICSPAEAHLHDSDTVFTVCCFSYTHRPIRRSLITSAYMTSSTCSQPAVILVTKKGRELCTNPQEPWVQAYLKHFQMLEY